MDIPKLKSPAGTCDCHMHIYEDRFTLAPNATFKPPHAPLSEYQKIQKALGLDRVVMVQPTAYAFNNTYMLDAMATLGTSARGICVIPVDTSDAELQRLHKAGVRGVRYIMLSGGVLTWDTLETMAARIAPYDWNINLQIDGREFPQHEDRLKKLPCKVVVDHNGKFLEPVTPDHASFKSLLRLLDSGNFWIKLAAPYETSKIGAPHYDDVSILAKIFAKTYPERCLWASNWPHPNQKNLPSTAGMLDLLLEWTDSEVIREKILVDNPAKLYGFNIKK